MEPELLISFERKCRHLDSLHSAELKRRGFRAKTVCVVFCVNERETGGEVGVRVGVRASEKN